MSGTAGTSRILRVYLDGPHGVGKSTTAEALVARCEPRRPIRSMLQEPMAYWRSTFASDAITEIYDTQHRLDSNEITAAEAGAFMTSLQLHMGTPYALLEEAMRPHVGRELAEPDDNGPLPQRRDFVLVVDRHAVASMVCYPLARFMMGCVSLRSVASLISHLPPPLPGTNLVVASLDFREHAARLRARARPGERLDLTMMAAIRNAYAMLANTSRYLLSGGDWRRDWGSLPVFKPSAFVARAAKTAYTLPLRDEPGLADTLFAALKVPEFLDARGYPRAAHAWTLDILANRIRALRVYTLDLTGPPEACAAAFRRLCAGLVLTEGSHPGALCELKRAAAAYAREMSVVGSREPTTAEVESA
uniref:Thymidine kinase n=1 Tax=Saimiriine herpesvirus 1 (strain MV-5-4-PSL) TaxID=10353 RepID=KITH_SHV1|nr:RecName: Full=Thymidine kinase [Saimiriine alphaherpesvirus 1]AAA67102.1 thymidine kinase [Saimiriine alphaherpesvirus 1]